MECCFSVRGVEINSGQAKICVPIMPNNMGELVKTLDELNPADFDIVEWRADALSGGVAEYSEGLKLTRRRLGESVPIIFTLRTNAEGGGFQGSAEIYTESLIVVAESGLADMVDVELSSGGKCVRSVAAASHKSGTRLIVSHHNFELTYPLEEILSIYDQMFDLGADIAKIALMASCFQDCLTALRAAQSARFCQAGRALIMVSMGRHGLTSRVMAQEFGSVITFGSCNAEKPSAPGQISAHDLRKISYILKKYALF